MPPLIYELFLDYTLRNVALGAGLLGLVSGTLGSFAVLRKQSLLGDAISHAALPGIALVFILTRAKSPFLLLLGAAIAGWVATLCMNAIIRHSRIKEDSALGLILSVFFGFGLVLLTFIQKIPDATQAGLEKYLFGQAATLLVEDIYLIAIVGSIALLIMLVFWKEFKLLSFDTDFGASIGYNMGRIDILLTSLIVVAIVLGLQTVGVVLMSAMIVAPAAAARQWTNSLGQMVVIAGFIGAISGISGALISSSISHMPTGPAIVLCVSAIVVLSLFFAPARGLTWNWVARQRNRRRIHSASILLDLYELAAQHKDMTHGHALAVLASLHADSGMVRRGLRQLAEKGWVIEGQPGIWSLTGAGITEAERLVKSGGDEA